MTVEIKIGDCLALLAALADESIDCIVTSPPYWGLRDYGIAGQIGMETTLGEHIQVLVKVFREVRRVLKKTGTCWLNYGDCYASTPNGKKAEEYAADGSDDRTFRDKPFSTVGPIFQPDDSERQKSRRGRSGNLGKGHQNGAGIPNGRIVAGGYLKPKDLCMVANRLAIALQEPWYAGRIRAEVDRAWLGAMIDGEGCIYIHRRPAGQHAGDGYFRTQDQFSCAFEIANTSEKIIQRCVEICGVGSVSRANKGRRQPIYRWVVRSNEARAILREVYPYLVAKQQQARIAFRIPSTGKDATAAWEAMKSLHAGSSSDVDFAAPESCFEQGWWVRSEIIWAKPNPMPDSTKDRPGCSHEKIWLLSKSERYFYDADAVSVPVADSQIGRVRDDAVGGKSHVERGQHSKGGRYTSGNKARKSGSDVGRPDGSHQGRSVPWEGTTRNLRNVWTIPTAAFSEAHFATFPPALVEPCIKAGCHVGGTVLDPFGGAGTVAMVAERLGRNSIMFELNPEYAEIARSRIKLDRLDTEVVGMPAPSHGGLPLFNVDPG